MGIKTLNGTNPNLSEDYLAPAADSFWDKLSAASAFTLSGSALNNISPSEYEVQNVDYVMSNLPDRENDENFFDDQWNRKKRSLISEIIPSINEYRRSNNLEELNYKAYRYLTDSDTMSEFSKRHNYLEKLAYANRTMSRNPASVITMSLAQSMVEPWNLLLTPYAMIGSATAGKAALKVGAATAALSAAEEAILYKSDPHRTPGFSAMSIGVGAVLGSAIGGVVAAKKTTQMSLIKDINNTLKNSDSEQHIVLDMENFYSNIKEQTVNLNIASSKDIFKAFSDIPGVGKVTAELLVKLRESKPNKIFDSYSDILNDPSITKSQKAQLTKALEHCTSPCRFHINGMPIGSDEAKIIGSYGLDKVAAITSPLARLLQSEFPEVRKEAVRLMNTPFKLSDNLNGVATAESVEELIDRNRIHYTNLVDSLESNYYNYLDLKDPNYDSRKLSTKLAPTRAGRTLRSPVNVVKNALKGNYSKMATPSGKLSFDEFKLDVLKHRSGSKISLDPNIINASKAVDNLFDINAKKVKDLMRSIYKGEDFTWIDEAPYVHRLWNKKVIADNPRGFVNFLTNQILKHYNGDIEEIRRIFGKGDVTDFDFQFDLSGLENSVNRLIRTPEERINLEDFFDLDASKRGAINNRVWNFIDDADLYKTDWAVHDIEAIANSYIMGPLADVEFYKTYGTFDVKEISARIRFGALKNLRENYLPKESTTIGKRKLYKKAEKNLEESLSLYEDMLRRVRGSYLDVWSPVPGGTNQQIIDNVKKYNNLRLGGTFGLRSFADTGRTVMFLGLKKAYGPFFEAYIKKNAKAMSMYDKASSELASINVGNEINSMNVVSSITNTNFNASNSNKFTKIMSKANSSMFIWNGLVLWNQAMKRNAGIGVMNEIVTSAQLARKGKLPSNKMENLAKLGLRKQDLYSIGKQFDDHGVTYKNVRLMNFENWTSEPSIANKVQRAVKKEVDTIIVTPGIGDTPLIMENSFVSMILQYRSFPMAAMLRQTIPLAQNMNGNALAGILISAATGIAARQYIDYAKGKEVSLDLDELLYQSLEDTGSLSTIGEFANYSKMIYNRNPFILGPTATGITDVYKASSSLLSGKELNQFEANAASRLVPYNGLRVLTQALVPNITSGE